MGFLPSGYLPTSLPKPAVSAGRRLVAGGRLIAAPGSEPEGGVGWDTVGYWPLARPSQQHPEVTAKRNLWGPPKPVLLLGESGSHSAHRALPWALRSPLGNLEEESRYRRGRRPAFAADSPRGASAN